MACRDAMCCVRGSSAQCEWPLEERGAERSYLMFSRGGAGLSAAGAETGIRTRDAGQLCIKPSGKSAGDPHHGRTSWRSASDGIGIRPALKLSLSMKTNMRLLVSQYKTPSSPGAQNTTGSWRLAVCDRRMLFMQIEKFAMHPLGVPLIDKFPVRQRGYIAI